MDTRRQALKDSGRSPYRRHDLRLMDDQTAKACKMIDAYAVHTGGGCMALCVDMSDGEHLLVTTEGTFPTSLADPVEVGRYGFDAEPIDGLDRFRTLAHFVHDLYGPSAGVCREYPQYAAVYTAMEWAAVEDAVVETGGIINSNGGTIDYPKGTGQIVRISCGAEVPHSLDCSVEVWTDRASDSTGESAGSVTPYPRLRDALHHLFGFDPDPVHDGSGKSTGIDPIDALSLDLIDEILSELDSRIANLAHGSCIPINEALALRRRIDEARRLCED